MGVAEGLLPQCQEAMAAIEGALQYFWAFASCCKSGNNAELRLIMEDGQLKVNMSASLGPMRPQSEDGLWFGLRKANNSQMRRRERRAAGRAAAAGARKAAEVAAEKAAAKVVVSAAEEAGDVTAEQAASIVAEEATAKNAAAKKATSEEVTTGKTAHVEKADPEAIAAEKVRMVSIEKDEESASTSTGNASSCCPTTSKVAVSVPVSTCWNCEEEMTVTHQCVTSPSSCLPPPPRTTPTLEVLSPAAARLRPDPSAPYIIKGKIRHLDGSPNVTPRPKK